MAEVIEVSIDSLGNDIETLTECVKNIRKDMTRMFEVIRELDAMWDGPANAAFNQQFLKDHSSLLEMCELVEEYIGSIEYAKTEYGNCESSIANVIKAIKIGG